MTAGFVSRSIGRRAALAVAGVLAGMALALTLALSPSARSRRRAPACARRRARPSPADPTSCSRSGPATTTTRCGERCARACRARSRSPTRRRASSCSRTARRGATSATGRCRATGCGRMGGIVVLLAAFFLLRGRIAIEHGWAGRTITRFSDLERFGHWLLATSFIILALTGLNVLYGRYVLLPLIGAELFSDHLGRRQVAAQLRGVRLHGRPGADLRRLAPPQLPELARRRLAGQGRRHVRQGLASAGLEVQRRAEDPVLARHAGRAVAVALGHCPDVPVPDGAVRQDIRASSNMAGLQPADRS